ncbi:hypothetical protein CALCODRAFT_263066 [Calocera cornea HHB12733]|uniref:Uncharacterized protein n=1 Tax=Calocera cornea HHB12733 TaxID=1353952 RepID=A0A165GGF3_9BASI|nr:hypothetical protein CALCODRAFT_263066 [Calocera cornea HHB12733]
MAPALMRRWTDGTDGQAGTGTALQAGSMRLSEEAGGKEQRALVLARNSGQCSVVAGEPGEQHGSLRCSGCNAHGGQGEHGSTEHGSTGTKLRATTVPYWQQVRVQMLGRRGDVFRRLGLGSGDRVGCRHCLVTAAGVIDLHTVRCSGGAGVRWWTVDVFVCAKDRQAGTRCSTDVFYSGDPPCLADARLVLFRLLQQVAWGEYAGRG